MQATNGMQKLQHRREKNRARTNTSAISKVKWRLLFNSFDADVNKSRRQRHGVEMIPPQKS